MTMQKHWLTQPRTIRKLWQLFIAVLVLTLLAGLLVTHDAHFEFERWFGFSAAFGFVACAALIILAKAIGVLLKRPDDYYERRGD